MDPETFEQIAREGGLVTRSEMYAHMDSMAHVYNETLAGLEDRLAQLERQQTPQHQGGFPPGFLIGMN